MRTRSCECILHLRKNATRERIALPIAPVPSIILVIELRQESGPCIDGEKGFRRSVCRVTTDTRRLPAEQVLRRAVSLERGVQKRTQPEDLVNFMLSHGDQIVGSWTARTARAGNCRVQLDFPIAVSN